MSITLNNMEQVRMALTHPSPTTIPCHPLSPLCLRPLAPPVPADPGPCHPCSRGPLPPPLPWPLALQVYRHLGPTVADLALPTTDSQVPTSQPEPGTT